MSTLSERTRQGRSRTRREDQKLETERLIKEAAFELFRAHGYDGTTTKQIAQAAGVAEGTIFHVAPSKEGLLVVVFEERLRGIAGPRLATLPKRGVAAQLAHFCEPLFDFFAEHPDLSRALLKGMQFPSDPVARARRDAHVADLMRVLVAMFEKARDRGELAPGAKPEVCAHNVYAIYVDALTGFVAAPDRERLRVAFRERIDALLRGALERSHGR